jgi:hypothetical protein
MTSSSIRKHVGDGPAIDQPTVSEPANSPTHVVAS